MLQAEYVADLMQRDGLDVEPAGDRSNDPLVLGIVEVKRLGVELRVLGAQCGRGQADAQQTGGYQAATHGTATQEGYGRRIGRGGTINNIIPGPM